MKKLIAILISIAIVLGLSGLFNQYRLRQSRLELERITAFNNGYSDHVLAASKSDDILVVKAEIDTAMDYLFTLKFDTRRANKAEKQEILDWYAERLATRGVIRDVLERGGLAEGDTWMLKDIIVQRFLLDGKPVVPDKIWLNTFQTNDKNSDKILGALMPDVTEDFFGDDFSQSSAGSQLSIETPLPYGKGVFFIKTKYPDNPRVFLLLN